MITIKVTITTYYSFFRLLYGTAVTASQTQILLFKHILI